MPSSACARRAFSVTSLVILSWATTSSHTAWADDLISSGSSVHDELILLQMDAKMVRITSDLNQSELKPWWTASELRELERVGGNGVGGNSSSEARRRRRRRRIESSSLLRGSSETATLTPKNVAWLHVPKCGTSFANVLAGWACRDLEPTEMMTKEHEDGGIYVEKFVREHKQDCAQSFHIYDGHMPMRDNSRNDFEKHIGTWVTMLRQPEQRLISGFNHNRHDAETPEQHHADLPTYAKLLSGCTVRMLNGFRCGEPVEITESMVQTGTERIDSGFAFVGLTEEWELSVCLFHKMFGGSCSSREFVDVRPGMQHDDESDDSNLYDIGGLENWTDPYDGPIYDLGAKRFWQNVEAFGVSADSCRACTDVMNTDTEDAEEDSSEESGSSSE